MFNKDGISCYELSSQLNFALFPRPEKALKSILTTCSFRPKGPKTDISLDSMVKETFMSDLSNERTARNKRTVVDKPSASKAYGELNRNIAWPTRIVD